jgi:hypothetical protein
VDGGKGEVVGEAVFLEVCEGEGVEGREEGGAGVDCFVVDRVPYLCTRLISI